MKIFDEFEFISVFISGLMIGIIFTYAYFKDTREKAYVVIESHQVVKHEHS